MVAAETLVALQSAARMVTLAEAGHLPHQVKPEAAIEAVRDPDRLLRRQE